MAVWTENQIRQTFAMIPGEFPQLFPQVWKTMGRDQTRMGLELRVGL
jgi:hypothetical protein